MHQRLSHSHRVDILSRKIAGLIAEQFPAAEQIRCVDVGCGDMQVSESIGRYNQRTVWRCIDIHALPEQLKSDEKWTKYLRFDGLHIPFADNAFDVVLFCDVLHHTRRDALALLKEAARVGSIIIVKDHFEYSSYSRIMLKLMDFVGNWGYGINLPDNYFTVREFEEICFAAGLALQKKVVGIDLYSHIPLIRRFLRPRWQFIAVLLPGRDVDEGEQERS